MVNCRFSAESVQAAIKVPNVRMRYYVEKFLREVGLKTLLVAEGRGAKASVIPLVIENRGVQISGMQLKKSFSSGMLKVY